MNTGLEIRGKTYLYSNDEELTGLDLAIKDGHYLLDLMRVTPRDANYIGPGSRFCILRPELITAFCQAKATERSKTKSTSQGDAHIASNSPNVDGEIQKHEKANNFSLLIP
ncbi:hypothetical protein FEM48_Zijuj09G0072500 [Ziziphus jujuba var. spinosa]|uniref:Uncharacterized protein n=1 Tax=Ziziphus jujuba var. spinosa TaxID=714518 RepID=A0A978URL0_ZIZJJ|nr:hypothetical protein FEM48_Zijuj09G0072500 [Ziziphus jujuba var. spinosa]